MVIKRKEIGMKRMVEEFLEYDYQSFKNYIRIMDDDAIEVLKDIRVKEKFINCDDGYDFIFLIKMLSDNVLQVLFDYEGIEVLSRTNDLVTKLKGIITTGKKFIEDLVMKDSFCKLLLDNFRELSDCFYVFNSVSSLRIINYVVMNNGELVNEVLVQFPSDIQNEIVKRVRLSVDVTRKLLVNLSLDSVQFILDNDFRINSLNGYNFRELYSIFSSGCRIPVILLEEDDFVKKITTMKNVKSYRFLINELIKNNDVLRFEKARKKYYDQELCSYDKNLGMLKRYSFCYRKLCDLIDSGCSYSYDEMIVVVEKYFNLFDLNDDGFLSDIDLVCSLGNKEGLRDYFVRESNLQIGNMIIDYHFEEVPYNFFLDVEQLCNFQDRLGDDLIISREDLDIYKNLLNIDKLSYEEKMLLHESLSGEDFVSKHYDIFRKAKDKVSALIREQMLAKESIIDYYDEKFSRKNGINVYTLNGEKYVALVKSLRVMKDRTLEKFDIIYYVDGASYSLDGSLKLNTFYDPRVYYNLIYDDFPLDQIVHVFPVDSFSSYNRGGFECASKRVNYLVTPYDLINLSYQCSEIVIAQKNNCKIDELNSRLGVPSILGIYCYDEITDLDVASAKNLGCAIVLVNTKVYDRSLNSGKISVYETRSDGGKILNGYSYIDNVNCDDMKCRRKKM